MQKCFALAVRFIFSSMLFVHFAYADTPSHLQTTATSTSQIFWPLWVAGKASAAPNANGIRYGIGPRAVDGYDFHAGLDLPAANLTPAYAVADGTVTGVNAGSGSEGNQVIVDHGDGRFTIYDHLSATGFPMVSVGAKVVGGTTKLGNVGDTGAVAGNYHLHLTYIVASPGSGYTGTKSNERLARSPLELLPRAQTAAADIGVKVKGSAVEISLPVAATVTRFVVSGAGQTRSLDYYAVLSEGSTDRNNTVQAGLGIAVAPPAGETDGRIVLTLDTAAGGAFTPETVTLFDYAGNIVYPTAVAQGGMTLQSSANPVAYRQPVMLTAMVAGANATGTVTFAVQSNGALGVIVCNAVSLVSGSAMCPIPGARNISNVQYSAAYSGDAANSAASATLRQVVNMDSATVTALALPQQPSASAPMTLRAMVTARNLAGKVAFFEKGAALAGCGPAAVSALPVADASPPLNADVGIAQCIIDKPAVGAHSYVVAYTHATDPGFDQISLPVTIAASARVNYTDMWWAGEAENGWGVSITQHDAIQFIVLYVYDAAGKPVFYVLPNGHWYEDQETYAGALYQPTSSPFSAYDAASFKANASVGTATVSYTSIDSARLTYTIDGVAGSKTLKRQVFASEDGRPKLQVNDLWWGGQEQNGWGMNIAQQGSVLFPVWYTYDGRGRDTWFVVPGGTWNGPTFSGDIYGTNSSPWLGVPYNPAAFAPFKAGSLTLHFADQSNALMTYTINGVTQSKVITRRPY